MYDDRFDILCVTNRLLCKEAFLERIEKIALAKPTGVILREKDLNETDYRELAKQVMERCEKHHVRCILHSYADVAATLNCPALHLPLPALRVLSSEKKAVFSMLGASCHSVEEAVEAEALGCTYITTGHIFATDCKSGVPGRGIDFLERVCESVSVPVYAIGGITTDTIAKVRKSKAAGACVMSGLMTCENVRVYLENLK